MSQENGYPVRGILVGLKEGSMDLDEAEEMIEEWLKESSFKGYREAIVDAEKKLLARARAL